MCGINGIYSLKNISNINDRINNMNNSIAHRGPDDFGYLVFSNKIALGHRRLSIIDTNPRAKQPMTSNSGRWIIIFNGEIYNFLDLKRKVDYKYLTTSDTEVILAYVEKFGLDKFLNDCNGMFAMALYDKKSKLLYLARDRFGIKPLYYYIDNSKLIFSSEIKGVLNSGIVNAEFNENAIDEYLGYRFIREPNTFFKGINQCESGQYYTIDESLVMSKTSYWKLPREFNIDKKFDEKSIFMEFDDLINKSIHRRLMADVNLGTYLSGGLDSSIISAITSIYSDNRINTYTIGFPELNEFKYAQIISEKYKTQHHEILIDVNEYLNSMEEIINYKDSPLGVPNEIPLAKMSRKLKERITVVLSGEGADELMGGYGRIYRAPFDYQNHKDKTTCFYKYFIDLYEYIPRIVRDRFIITSKVIRDEFDKTLMPVFSQRSNEENVFRFFHNYHIKGLLNRVDTTTMLASVEARVPFLDHELVEYSYTNIPYDLKLRWKSEKLKNESKKLYAESYSELNDIPKYLLKEIGYKYLDKRIVNRKKVGFPVPLNEWVDLLTNISKEMFNDSFWLNKKEFFSYINSCGKNNQKGRLLWMLINIELFRKTYFNKSWIY